MSLKHFLPEWAQRDYDEVSGAPRAVVALLVVGIGVGWWLGGLYYQREIAVRDQVLALRDAQIASLQEAKGTTLDQVVSKPTEIHGTRLSLVPLIVVVVVFLASVVMALSEKRSRREAADARKSAATATAALLRVEEERDKAVVELKDKKHKYAMEVLDAYSQAKFKDPQPKVTVRCAGYGEDYTIAEQVKGLITQYVKWEADIDPNNIPPLGRADKFKVVFDVGKTVFTYKQLAHAFSEGDLLGVTVGMTRWVEREDSHHLIVMVLPSVGAEPIRAESA